MRASSYSNVGGANVGNSVPSNVTAYIPITITNQEYIGISSGFQQLLKMESQQGSWSMSKASLQSYTMGNMKLAASTLHYGFTQVQRKC